VQDFPIVIYDVEARRALARFGETKINRDLAPVVSPAKRGIVFTAHQGQTVNVFRLGLGQLR